MRRAVITGASSGIGFALAQELGRRGWALGLIARRAELLEKACGSFRAVALPADVTDGAALLDAVRRGEKEFGGPFDLAIANAGVHAPTHAAKFKLAAADQIIRVNLLGMVNLFAAVIPSMIDRRTGRFAGVASVAGLRGLPTASAYSASKAGMQTFLEASRVDLRPYGVGVSIINPGFIETQMVAENRFRMPFLMTAERAAVIIADGLERGARVIEFPRRMSVLMRTARVLPDFLYDAMAVRMGRIKGND